VIILFVGVLIVALLDRPVFGTILACFILLGLSVLGLLFAIVSLLVRERFWVLSIVGLLLNAMPLIWLWHTRNQPIMYGP